MSLIKCPECGKEFSNRAVSCPNCGFPTSELKNDIYDITEANYVEYDGDDTCSGRIPYDREIVPRKKPKMNTGVFIVVSLVMVGIIVGIVIFNISDTKKQEKYETAIRAMNREDYEEAADIFRELKHYEDANEKSKYCDAQIYCANGDYENAYELLKSIPDYSDTSKLLKQIYYETRLFEGISDIRTSYFNPDSLGLSEVKAYYPKNDSAEIEHPAFIATMTGQNKMGGYASSYVYFGENSETGSYKAVGSVHSLDEDDYKLNREDDLMDLVVVKLIKSVKNDNIEIKDAIDQNRVIELVKSGKYTTIKRISELTYDEIGKETGESMSEDSSV